MRKSKLEAAQTRRRIVSAAAAEFRRNGIVATGLADLMKAAGLTHGGFYKHFESKDQVVAEACAESIAAVTEKVANAASGKGNGLEFVVAAYLSTEHRDGPAEGCPIAALGSELARSDMASRAAATAGVLKLVGIVAAQYRRIPADEARRRALVAVSTMVGALTISRVVNDTELSAEILRAAREQLAPKSRPRSSRTPKHQVPGRGASRRRSGGDARRVRPPR